MSRQRGSVVFHAEDQPTIFFVTCDGGATWQPTTAVVSSTDNSFVWSFPDLEHGCASDGDKHYVTADGAVLGRPSRPTST